MNDQTAKLSDIVSAAKAGSHVAFAELHAMYSRRLYKTIVCITKHPEDAEDALQETFLRAHLALHTFEGRSNIYSWLTRIAINTALMVLRRRRNRPETLFDFQSDVGDETTYFAVKESAPNPEEICDRRQRRFKVLRAIRSLHPGLQEPIQMQMTQGSSIREISQALDISETAVKTRLYRARLRLSAMHNLKHFVSHP
jgi:RNA polymerase sigma-70 factor, ECF subfamily